MNYYIPELWYQIWLIIILIGVIVTAILFARYKNKKEKTISLQDDKIRQLTNYIHDLEKQKEVVKDFEAHTVMTHHPIVTLHAQKFIDGHYIYDGDELTKEMIIKETRKSILNELFESDELQKCIDWTLETNIMWSGTNLRGTLMVVDPFGGFGRNE